MYDFFSFKEKEGVYMGKERIDLKVSAANKEYLVKAAADHGLTQTAYIVRLIEQDRKKSAEFVDELANAIYKKLDDRTKSIRIAVNENNKILKIQQRLINFLMMALGIKMTYTQYVKHPAAIAAEEEVMKEIKKLQVIKAEQRKKEVKI